jgi:hypothetical protein
MTFREARVSLAWQSKDWVSMLGRMVKKLLAPVRPWVVWEVTFSMTRSF